MNNDNPKKPLVLMVDDVPKNLQVLSMILKEENINIAAAVNGKQALDIIQKIKPDLILLDIMMPEMDGYDTLKQIKSIPENCDIPVIFLTARTEMKDIVTGLELGAVDYIAKPFNRMELLTRVRNHLELKSFRDALKEANSSKDKFFSIISHDLRTPFATVINFTEYLIDNFEQIDKNQLFEIYQDILSISKRSYKLFENLLQWARSQAGSIKFNPERVNIKCLVDDNVKIFKSKAKEKSIIFCTDIPDDLFVRIDKNMFDTIIRNLTSNAVKFTKHGGTIDISAEVADNRFRVSIIDTGIGIPKKTQKKLFRIDEHITTHGTDHEEGAGLGLLLVKEFVEKHQGFITVNSEEGKGSRFNLDFPIN